MLSWLLSNVRRTLCAAGVVLLAAAAPAQPPPTPTMICVCTTPTPVPTPAPRYTCARITIRQSEASPRDGAVYRVGEPVLIDSDPEFATDYMCPSPPFIHGSSLILSREVQQMGEDGIEINSFGDHHDNPVTLRFNLPGTVSITRFAWAIQWDYLTLVRRNVITIVDDGPTIFPPPTQAPPPTGPQPGIRTGSWLGTPPNYGVYGVATRDGEVEHLVGGMVENTGTADLVITEALVWISNGSANAWIKNPPPPIVVRPGQTRYFEYGMTVYDWNRFAFPRMVLVTNVPSRKYVPIYTYTPAVFDTAADIPDGYPFPPPIPATDDPSICNDSNNDGHIDASDIVHSLLGRE